jgi:transposase
VSQARAKQDMRKVRLVGIDETSVKRGQNYITVVHDLDEKRLLFATPGRDHDTVEQFAVDLAAHGGKRTAIKHACIDMSAAYAKGITESLPKAQISYDRFHVVALANKAMDEVRTAEWATERQRVQDELSLSGILCARHSMSTRSMYAEQKDDEGGAGRSGGDATDSQGHH